MNHWNIPIYKAVRDYARTLPTAFHMPGHKLGRGIPPEFLENIASMDLTEIPGTDNLHYPETAIREAQELAAQAFGADKSYFLVNGSTVGIHAMIMTVCRPGDRLIVSRDCHKSAINGLLLAGAEPVYVTPGINLEFSIPSTLNAEDIESAIEKNPDVRGVLVTRPTYYGICSDICEIARVAHSHNKILLVDEAHGAHLRFNRQLPVCAMDSGADMCVQSAHKTLSALTQGAYLHVGSDRVDVERLEFMLRMLQTSSPSYILMTFLDIARAIMQYRGEELLDGLLENIARFRTALRSVGGIRLLEGDAEGEHDPTRLVIHLAALGITGFEADTRLRRDYGIQVEMSDFYNLVCIATAADTYEAFERLEAALSGLSLKKAAEGGVDKLWKSRMSPVYESLPGKGLGLRDVCERQGTHVKLEKAVGRISRDMLTPYPPGIPVICPGEIISRRIVEYIYSMAASGAVIHGLDEEMKVNVVV